uniref:Uncharacterized protein n=1 Tax=Aegilops tauschii TaxID=37682 RepID=M8BFV6_AEGTA
MASKALLPRECLPRRSPRGGLEPITVYVRVDEEGNYHPSDDVFQFEFVVEPAADVSSLKASTSLEEKSSGSDKVPDEKPAEVSSLKDSLKATTLEEKLSSSSSGQQPDQDTVMASPPSGNCLASPSGPGIWQRERQDWGFGYYIRLDLKGSFHTYPNAGGPFKSLEEVGYCYGSTMHRDVNMKHPISADAYLAGQMEAKKEKDVADKTCMKMLTQPPTMRAFDADNMTFDDTDD